MINSDEQIIVKTINLLRKSEKMKENLYRVKDWVEAQEKDSSYSSDKVTKIEKIKEDILKSLSFIDQEIKNLEEKYSSLNMGHIFEVAKTTLEFEKNFN